MKKFKGMLLYMGWFNRPWNLITENGEVDLWPAIDKFLVSLDGMLADHDWTKNSYILRADESSEYRFKYILGESILLEKLEGFGMSNVYAYLEGFLAWLSGRMVDIEIEDGNQIKFMANTDESVHGVYFVGEGNSCEIVDGDERNVCKMGQHDCCIFLTIGAGGFFCEKFSGPTARILLDRLAKGSIRASRIGSCEILGRKE